MAEILRCAKDLKLKARIVESSWDRLAKTSLPAIAERSDGSFIIVSKVADAGALIFDPIAGSPQSIDRARFESEWSGRLILMTRRASLADTARRFDITWFLQAMVKYRRILSEVFIASFFLQLFALVSPLFFQVVIDKVLVHRLIIAAARSMSSSSACSSFLFSKRFLRHYELMFFRIRRIALTLNWTHGYSSTSSVCLCPILRPAAPVTAWRACANWKISAISSPAPH